MADYSVENLTSQRMRIYKDLKTSFRPAGLLPVPYVSQTVQGALRFQNDCGPACAAMLLRAYLPNNTTSVDDLFLRVSTADEYLNFGQLNSILTGEGLEVLRMANLKMPQVFELLRGGRPIIALINYGVLNKAGVTEKKTFNGPHFVVVVGMDCSAIYTHDPYYSLDNGEAVPYPFGLFYEAWRRASEQFSNPAFAGLIPVRSLYPEENARYPSLYRIRLKAAMDLYKGPGSNNEKAPGLLKNTKVDVCGESADHHWGLVRPWPGHWIDLTNKNIEKVLPGA
jgi:uncharacterized protein YvpB